MKRVLFTLVACLVGISSLMAQSFSLPGYLFGRCPDYSIPMTRTMRRNRKMFIYAMVIKAWFV